jgi:hypothetical protein
LRLAGATAALFFDFWIEVSNMSVSGLYGEGEVDGIADGRGTRGASLPSLACSRSAASRR